MTFWFIHVYLKSFRASKSNVAKIFILHTKYGSLHLPLPVRGHLQKNSIFKDIVQIGGREVIPISKNLKEMIIWQKLERDGFTTHIVKNRNILFCMTYYSIWPNQGTLCLSVCTPNPQKVIRTSWGWAVPSSSLARSCSWNCSWFWSWSWSLSLLVRVGGWWVGGWVVGGRIKQK